jgi:hypothetical protein
MRPRTRLPPSTRPCHCGQARFYSTSSSPDRDGIWVAKALNEAGIRSRILLASSAMTDMSSRTLDRCGAVAFFPKTELATTDLSGLLR